MSTAEVNEQKTRILLSEMAASVFKRVFSVGSAGNISVRLADGYLMVVQAGSGFPARWRL